MNPQNEEIIEKIAEALLPTGIVKNDDYFKIWESWGMTKAEWQVVESKRVPEGV